MPKETFLNLNAAKREQFLAAAFREFAEHDYRSASVSRIVAGLRIAKGSVYQYFRDKQDLYFHLLDVASMRKLEFIRASTDASGAGSFYELHEAVILAGATFDFRNPHHGLLIMNALVERQGPELRAHSEQLRRRSADFLRDHVRLGIDRRDIRPDVDAPLLLALLDAATLAIARYMEDKYGFSLIGQLEHPERPLPFTEAQLGNDVHALVDVVRRGIGVAGLPAGSAL